MTAINTALKNISLGEAQIFENLQITPLLAPAPLAADYLTLDEAQTQGLATVTEVDDSGSVPTLLLENKADVALFLLDGEELLGAKQNRVLNLTLLVPAKTRLHIPVSCVEKGRWSHRSAEFTSADRAMFSKGRARKAARVSENLRAAGSRQSNQSEVWDDISLKMSSMEVNSDTDAMADAYEHFTIPMDQYVSAFAVQDTQVGACFAINGSIRGVELFDASDTCGKLMPKLIRSYALDAIEESREAPAESSQSVNAFLQAVADTPVDNHDALGEGEDLRIHSNTIAGGALAARDCVIHLCAFNQESEDNSVDPSGGIRSASARQRYRANRAQSHDFSDDVDDQF
jgi:hypothetical protein